MKLNNKGYLTVEIILASVITFIIAFFLIEITMKLVGKTDDAYNDTIFYTEKAIVTKNLKEVIEDDTLTSASGVCGKVKKTGNTISYGNDYEKNVNDKLTVGSVSCRQSDNYIFIKIPMSNTFMNNNYDINVFVDKS